MTDTIKLLDALYAIDRSASLVLNRIGKGQTNPPMYTVLRAIREDARRAIEAVGKDVTP